MAGVFVFGSTPDVASEMLACVQEAGQKGIVITTGGQDVQDYRNLACESVIHIQGGSPLPEAYGRDIAAVLKEQGAQVFVVGGDTTGRDVAARVAGVLDAPMMSEATNLAINEEGTTGERLAYGGAVVRQEGMEGFGVVSVAPGAWAPLDKSDVEAPVSVVAGSPDTRMQLTEVLPLEKSGVDLTKAERIVCAGMAFSTREELETAFHLADALDAEVGCSRGLAEDRQWFSEYIGLSGVQVAPKLYVGLGISGQVQHTVGIRGANIVVAINKDPSAPLFSNCDYGVVGDLFDVAEAFSAALGK